MAINQETFNTDLYKLLRTRGYKPVPKDVKNQRTQPEEAEVFNFTFTKDGKDYGDAWVTIDEAQNVVLYYSNEQEESPSGKSPNLDYDDSWSGLKRHLKQWSMNKQLSFELRNKDELGDDMAQRDYVKKKEKMNEGYHSMGKKASYNDNIPAVKIILQHNRQIEEGEQRYRNIAKIFLENQDGERFLAPTTRPGIAQVYARHIAEGGVPNDERWNHIKSICEEYSKMAGFVRATKNKQFNESAQSLVNEGINHYQSLRETLGKLRGHRGYNTYFESWTPALMEDDTDGTQINELFVQETVDPRIESVMPILSRLHKKIGETPVKEVSELEQWADSIVEGETLNELGDSDEDKLSPTERNEQKERDKKEYDKNLKKTPDAIKKKLNLPDNIDEGQSNDKESTREKIKSLQATLKSVKGNYPGDDRNRQLIRSEIFDLKQKLKNKSDLSEDSGSDFIHLPPDIFLLHTHKAPRNHVQLWNNWWQRNGFTADEKTNLLRKGNDLYRFNYDEKGLEKVKTDLSEETLEEGTSDLKLPAGFFKAGRGIEALLLKQSGKMPSYHAAMSDRHLEYARRAGKSGKQEERDFHISQHKHHIDQMLSLVRSKDKNDKSDLSEDSDTSPVESAIIRRIINVRTELLGKHGPEKVLDAVKEVADFVGDVDEIGSSDVSGWIRQVEGILGHKEIDEDLSSMMRKGAKKVQRAFSFWDGSAHLEDLKDYVKNASDETLIRLAKDAKDDPKLHSPRAVQIKLIDRELKRRYGLTPKGNIKPEETLEGIYDRRLGHHVPRDGKVFSQDNHPRVETCEYCGEETGRAGPGEDSIYDNDGNGPYCEECYHKAQEENPDLFNEGLDKNQKKAGQLGPTEKVGKEGAVGKLVGANESIDPLAEIKRLMK